MRHDLDGGQETKVGIGTGHDLRRINVVQIQPLVSARMVFRPPGLQTSTRAPCILKVPTRVERLGESGAAYSGAAKRADDPSCSKALMLQYGVQHSVLATDDG